MRSGAAAAILTAVRALELSLLTTSLLLFAGMFSTLLGGLVAPEGRARNPSRRAAKRRL